MKLSFNQILISVVIILILILSGGLWYFYNKSQNLDVQLKTSEQNNAALKDEVRVNKDKVGELEYSKRVLIGDKKIIESHSESLAKELSETKKDVFELTKLNAELKNEGPIVIENHDTIYASKDSIYSIGWEYEKKFTENSKRLLAGITKFKLTHDFGITNIETIVNDDIIDLSIILGMRETDDGDIEMFAKSDYPGFGVNGIESAIINPTSHPVLNRFTKPKSKIRFTINSGYGFTYSFQENKMVYGPQLGVGISWSPF